MAAEQAPPPENDMEHQGHFLMIPTETQQNFPMPQSSSGPPQNSIPLHEPNSLPMSQPNSIAQQPGFSIYYVMMPVSGPVGEPQYLATSKHGEVTRTPALQNTQQHGIGIQQEGTGAPLTYPCPPDQQQRAYPSHMAMTLNGTPYPANPGTPCPANPGTPCPANPGTTYPANPGTPYPANPGTPYPANQGTQVHNATKRVHQSDGYPVYAVNQATTGSDTAALVTNAPKMTQGRRRRLTFICTFFVIKVIIIVIVVLVLHKHN